jgi:hypothetical protein
VMPLRDAASSARRVMVDGARLAQDEVLCDLDGDDVGAEDVELDGQKEFLEDSSDTVAAGLLSHRLKIKNKSKLQTTLVPGMEDAKKLKTKQVEKFGVEIQYLVGNDLQGLRVELEVDVLHAPERLVMPDG